MVQRDEPSDYVLSTGECHSVKEFVEEVRACRRMLFWKLDVEPEITKISKDTSALLEKGRAGVIFSVYMIVTAAEVRPQSSSDEKLSLFSHASVIPSSLSVQSFKYVGMEITWVGEGVEEHGHIKGDPDNVVVRVDPRYFRPTEVELLLVRIRLGFKSFNWYGLSLAFAASFQPPTPHRLPPLSILLLISISAVLLCNEQLTIGRLLQGEEGAWMGT